MYFRILNNEISGELTYLLADQDVREAVLIDPYACDLPVLSALLAERDLRLRWVLRTHQHDEIQVNERAQLAYLGAPLVQGSELAQWSLEDGSFLPFGNEVMHLLKTPGHTVNCLSFGWRDRLFLRRIVCHNDLPTPITSRCTRGLMGQCDTADIYHAG